jgi:glycine reductase complex component B subunit gamma
MSKEIENAGLPTALITSLAPTALFMGVYRIVPGYAINHPLGNPALPILREKEMRRRIVLTALESLSTAVSGSKVFNWKDS